MLDIHKILDEILPEMIELSEDIYRHPELGFKEFRSREQVIRFLDAAGIAHTDVAYTGLTACLDSGKPGPNIGLIAEFDAVPTLGHPYAAEKDYAAHTCGHYAQIGVMLSLFLALKKSDILSELCGKVTLLVTPGEEFCDMDYRKSLIAQGKLHYPSGKQEMIAVGAFDDIDIMLSCHTMGIDMEEKQERLDERKERIINEANEKANAILREAKEVADETMKNFRKFGKENISAAEMERERERLRQKIKKTGSGVKLDTKKPKKQHKPSDFKLGEAVKVLSLNLTGTVSSLPNAKGDLFVQMGILRSQVNISDLEIIDEPVITGKHLQKTSSGKMKMKKTMSVRPEINLLGKTVDEAIAELDKYLDDAYMSHISPVRIVHGKGTGALRSGIHNYLKRQKHVKSYRLGAFGEGDAGVTIVEFK